MEALAYQWTPSRNDAQGRTYGDAVPNIPLDDLEYFLYLDRKVPLFG